MLNPIIIQFSLFFTKTGSNEDSSKSTFYVPSLTSSSPTTKKANDGSSNDVSMTSTTSNPVAEDNKNANVVEKNLVILLFISFR